MNCPISGFTSYPTAQAAWNVIRLLTSKRALLTHKQPGKPGGFAYRCAHCHQWHITSQQSRHRPADWLQRRTARMERELRG
jgi:hypothetical protein